MNNSAFGKCMENIRNHSDIKLVTSEKKRKRLVSEPNYYSCKKFSGHLMALEMKTMNKALYLGMSILDISKTLMYNLWYDYFKPKYGDRAKLCYTNTDSFIIHIKTEDFFQDICNDVEKWFDTSNYDKNDKRPLPIGKNKKVLGLFKDELGGKIITEFVALRPKAYTYLGDYGNDHKKSKGTKKSVIKQKLTFQNSKDRLFNNKNFSRSQQRFKSYNHDVYTEEVNKITLSSNDDKRLQTFDRIIAYPYGTNSFKVCESEMLLKNVKVKCKNYNKI